MSRALDHQFTVWSNWKSGSGCAIGLGGRSSPIQAVLDVRFWTNAAIRLQTGGKGSAPFSQAAQLFGVTQPRVSDLVRGKIDLFSLDALVNMASTAGLHVEMRVLEAA